MTETANVKGGIDEKPAEMDKKTDETREIGSDGSENTAEQGGSIARGSIGSRGRGRGRGRGGWGMRGM